MSGKANVLCVCAFFAANPEEELTRGDMMLKFNFGDRSAVLKTIRTLMRAEYLAEVSGARWDRSNPQTYQAGRELLRVLGRKVL